MNESAWIVHRIGGRLRFRLPQRRKQAAFFAELGASLEALAEVRSVRVNPAIGSVLVEYDAGSDGADQVTQLLAARGMQVREGDPPVPPALPLLRAGAARVDRYLGEISQQGTDLRSLGVLALFALSLVQLGRGHVLGPSATLMWQALSLLRDGGDADGDVADSASDE